MKIYYLVIATVFVLISSCAVEPQPIQYNQDECAYCKMKISDPRFGAELVTSKGKVYKYDSAECLFRTYLEEKNTTYSYKLVTDFSQPNTLIPAGEAIFVISEKQPSPMGGNLSAYASKNQAINVVKEKGGDVLSFDGVLNKYRDLYE